MSFMQHPDEAKEVKNKNGIQAVNRIHDTEGGSSYGYKAALVGGVTSYGWTVPTIMGALGEDWLDNGWIDIEFRRPIYPDEKLKISIYEEEAKAGQFRMEVTKGAGPDLERCLTATLGLGKAPFFEEMLVPPAERPEAKPATEKRLDPSVGPTPGDVKPLVGKDLIPMGVNVSERFIKKFAEVEMHLPETDPFWGKDAKARLHPSHLAQQCTPLFIHNVGGYKAGIHTRSQIQHLNRGYAGNSLTVSGRIIDAFERKGHNYMVADVTMGTEDTKEVARIRHHLIYQPAKRPARN